MKPSEFNIAELYEAAVDDAAFADLPDRLARLFDSRSAVIHWLDHDDRSTIDAHSGHFSDQHMAIYTDNFADSDIWTQAAAGSSERNTAWRASDLVAQASYAKSVFYNEWIRPIGDDTWFCAGAVMETPRGFGIIGLHRGYGDRDYGVRTIGRLNALLPDLRRALTLRARTTQRIQALKGALQVLSEGSSPALIVDRAGSVRLANTAGEILLSAGSVLKVKMNRVTSQESFDPAEWRRALERATRSRDPGAAMVALECLGDQLWLAEFLPIVAGTYAGCAMITLVNRSAGSRRASVAELLGQRFNLSAAEAGIAILLAEDADVQQIAEMRGTTVQTVRYQIKQILAKTGARRQSEIVSLTLRLALL